MKKCEKAINLKGFWPFLLGKGPFPFCDRVTPCNQSEVESRLSNFREVIPHFMVNRFHFPMVAAAGTVWIRFVICMKILMVSNSALAIAKLGIKNALKHGLSRYPELKEFDRRILKDRRKHPTPALSRYALWGERRTLRRKRDQQAGGYVDSYSPTVFFFVISIVGLNVIDAFQTIMLLDLGGWEVNPIVQSAMRLYGDNFWIWKFFIASASVVFLCLHSKFRKAKPIIVFLTILYIVIVFYHFLLIRYG